MAIIHLYYFVFYWAIKAGTENRHSPETNFGHNRRFGPARAFTDNPFFPLAIVQWNACQSLLLVCKTLRPSRSL